MKLSGLLKPKHIVADLGVSDRWEAIEALLDLLVERGAVEGSLRGEILQSLKEREDVHSTGVGEGVAIPHAFCSEIEDVVAAFGRSKKGVDFEADDGLKAHFVVLFVSPRSAYQKHLLALAAIARHFTKVDTRKKLLAAEDAEEIYQILRAKNVEI